MGILLNTKLSGLCHHIMAKRKTIVLDEDLARKIKLVQAKQIKNSSSSVSFSKVFNQQLQKALK